MNAYTFRRHDSLRGQEFNRGNVSIRRTLNFRGNCICLSDMLAKDLGVKAGSHLAFTYDEDKPSNIYVRTADNADDTKDIQCKLSFVNGTRSRLRCKNKAVVQHVLNQIGATESCTCYVAPIETKIEGKDHYQILVSCPILIH